MVPAALPILNFSPWTGWLVFEELDLLILGLAAGAYAHYFWQTFTRTDWVTVWRRDPSWASLWLTGLWIFWLGLGMVSIFRGFADAGGFAFDWFAGYEAPLNTLRVAKSLLLSLLLAPLLARELQVAGKQASLRLGYGMVTGLLLVNLAVLWERMAIPGLLEFSIPYRTTAWFWEMHVGGAAIDIYLVMAAPFAIWALRQARRPSHWAAAALLVLLTAYTCLTTFSRGVYLAVIVSSALMLCLSRRSSGSKPQDWPTIAGLLLMLALLGEVLLVFGSGSFMRERVARSDKDLGSRIVHWQNGLALLSGPQDWWLGKGLGRLPANYASAAPQGEFSGQARLLRESETQTQAKLAMRLAGPLTLAELGGHYGMTQRVALVPTRQYALQFDVRVREPTQLEFSVCERHLLYARQCQVATRQIKPGTSDWQQFQVPLIGPKLSPGAWYAPRLGMFSISIVNPGGLADFAKLSLTAPGDKELLSNRDFSQGLAYWFPVAQEFFLPWHIDSLGLELLIERGILGLLIMGAMVLTALWLLLPGHRANSLAACLAASIVGVLVVGLVSSVLDAPRGALLFFLLIYYPLLMPRTPQ